MFPPFHCLLFIIYLVLQVQFGCIGMQPIVQGFTRGLCKMLWELGASGWFGWNSLTSLDTVGAKIKHEAEVKIMLMRNLLGISKTKIQPISYLCKFTKQNDKISQQIRNSYWIYYQSHWELPTKNTHALNVRICLQ